MSIPRGFVKFRRDAVGGGMRERIKELLTVVPSSTSSWVTDKDTTIRMWAEDGDYVGVARGFFNEKLLGRYVEEYEFVPSLGSNDLQTATPITPRAGQQELIERALAVLQSSPFGGVIIDAKTAAGKTVIGLEIARRLGLKTMVIVHTSVLASQWVPEILKFFPHYRIGTLQADKIDVANKDIVIGMLNSVSMKDYPPSIYEEFGTVVIDECHKAGALEFSKALLRFAPKHFVGLSGSVSRADKAEKVFIHGIGKVVLGGEDLKVMDPVIYFIDTGLAWFGGHGPFDRQKNYFLRYITTCDVRNEIIVRQSIRAAQAGRNVLVLGERVGHLEHLYSLMKRRGADVGLMVGTTSVADRAKAQKAPIVCATNQLVGTGWNEPRMDTLTFATPIQDVTQPVGRIRRELEGKKTPFVLDIVDSNSEIGLVLGNARRKRYAAKGWKMVGAEIFKKLEESRRR